jgi:hypothetical protein
MACRAREFSVAGLGIACLIAFITANNSLSYARVVYGLPTILNVLVDPLDNGEVNPVDILKSPKRGRIALLESLKLPVESFNPRRALSPLAWNESRTGKNFETGNFGVVAVNLEKPWWSFFSIVLSDKTLRNEKEFSRQWKESQGRRVYLAFRRADAELANAAATAIEEQGYTVYAYLNDPDKPPRFPAEYTAKIFYEADYRLALVTANSFTSDGKLTDGLLWERLSLDVARGTEAFAKTESTKTPFERAMSRVGRRAREEALELEEAPWGNGSTEIETGTDPRGVP